MPTYPLRALALRKTKLGEADLIITMLGSDGRQVRAVAKGARKPKSRLGGRIEPLTVLDLLLHTGRTLEVIAEAEIAVSHDALRRDLDRSFASGVVADLLDKASAEGQAEPQLYDMAIVTLDVMETAPLEALRPLVVAFLLKALAMQGYRPILDACSSCGGTPHGVALFSPETGGLLCGDCSGEYPLSIPVGPDALSLMRVLLRSRMSEIAALEVPAELAAEVMRPVATFVRYHLPARLKSLEMYARGQ